jgi:hypothetical protein
MNLEELSTAWNELRNRVMGRTPAKPDNISADLYRAVGTSYEEWRNFLLDNTALLQTYGTAELVSLPASTWVERYRDLQGWAAAEGVSFDKEGGNSATLQESPQEVAVRLAREAAERAKEIGKKLEVGLVVVAIGFGAIIALRALNK